MSEEASIIEPLFLSALMGPLKSIEAFIQYCVDYPISSSDQKILLQIANQAITEHPDDSNVLMLIGVLYHRAEEKAADYDEAISFYDRAITFENTYAMFNRAVMHGNGLGGQVDIDNTIELLKQAIKLDNSLAMFTLAHMHESGKDCPENFLEAIRLYKKAIRQDHTGAMNNLAIMYELGKGCEKNLEKARELYEQASELGNVLATYNLARMYEDGIGCQKNIVIARALYKQAGEEGNLQVTNELARKYQYGLCGEKDPKKAIQLYKKAIAQDHAGAMNSLAIMYLEGKDCPQDVVEAKNLFQQASKLGNTDAMNNLGSMYQHGIGGEKNYTKAKKLYEQASERGDIMAKNNLAGLYRDGKGCEKDHKKAAKFYDEAIEQGNPEAMLNRGEMYEFGQGSDVNLTKAFELYVRALQKGLKKNIFKRLAELANKKQENAAFYLFFHYQRAGNLLEATYWFNKNETKILKLLCDEISKQISCPGTDLQPLKQLFIFAERKKIKADSATILKIEYLKMKFLLHDKNYEEAIYSVNNILVPSNFSFNNNDLRLIADTLLKLSRSSKEPNQASPYREQAKTNLYNAYQNDDLDGRNLLLDLLREDAGLPSLEFTQNESAQADETDQSLLIQFEKMQEITAEHRRLIKAAIEAYLHPTSRRKKMLRFFSSAKDDNNKACRKIMDALETQDLSHVMERDDIRNLISDPELKTLIDKLMPEPVTRNNSYFQIIDTKEEGNRLRR